MQIEGNEGSKNERKIKEETRTKGNSERKGTIRRKNRQIRKEYRKVGVKERKQNNKN
jgi:hypothetical protein